jgi:hypothetical protein
MSELVIEAMRCRGEATPPLLPPLAAAAAAAAATAAAVEVAVLLPDSALGEGLEDGRKMLCNECEAMKTLGEFSVLTVTTAGEADLFLLFSIPFSLAIVSDLFIDFELDFTSTPRSESSSSSLRPPPAADFGIDKSCGNPLLSGALLLEFDDGALTVTAAAAAPVACPCISRLSSCW